MHSTPRLQILTQHSLSMHSLRNIRAAATLALAALLTNPTHASLIVWQSPADATSVSDILSTGTFVAAKSGYAVHQNGGPITVGGVAFGDNAQTLITFGGNTGFGIVIPDEALPNSGDTDYNNLLSKGYFTPAFDTANITLSGLTIGDSYRVQLWVPVWDHTWTTTFSTSNGETSTSVDMNNVYTAARYVVGNFVADGTSQTIVYGQTVGPSSAYGLVAAAAVFNLSSPAAVPEPGTYAALAGLAALGLVVWRRRQQR